MKKLITAALCAAMLLSSVLGVASATKEEEQSGARGIVFTEDSGFYAYPYTGYITGAEFKSTTVKDLVGAMENSLGATVVRGDKVLGDTDTVGSGDLLVVKNDDGTVVESLELMSMGDVNKDSAFNLQDVSTLMKKVARWDIEMNEVAADVDGDGAVSLSDASALLKSAAGWAVDMVKVPVLPGKYKMTYFKFKTPFNSAMDGTAHLPLCLSDGVHYDLGVTFTVKEGDFAVQFDALCPSWADNEGRVTFSVYKWKGDYATTIASTPIKTTTIEDYTDNSTLTVDLTDSSGKGLVPGEYLWRMHDCYDDLDKDATGVGIWYYDSKGPAEGSGMTSYLNQKPFNIGPVANIYTSTIQK